MSHSPQLLKILIQKTFSGALMDSTHGLSSTHESQLPIPTQIINGSCPSTCFILKFSCERFYVHTTFSG